jgi:hypothetical protein
MKVLICESGINPSLILTDVEDFSNGDQHLKLYSSNATLGFQGHSPEELVTKIIGEIDLGEFVKLIVEGYKEGMHK